MHRSINCKKASQIGKAMSKGDDDGVAVSRFEASPAETTPITVCGQGPQNTPGEGTPPWNFIHRKEPTPPCKKFATGQLHNSFRCIGLFSPAIAWSSASWSPATHQIPPQCAGLYVRLANPLLMMLPTLVFSYMFRFDIPNFPLVSHLRQHHIQLLQREHEHGHGQCAGQCVTPIKSVRAQVHFPISRVVSAL